MERRDFLKVAALSGAAIAVSGIDALAGRDKDIKGEAFMDDKPVREFRYRPDGKFKILQLTDTHYVAGDKRSERALANVIEMLDTETPYRFYASHLAVFNEQFANGVLPNVQVGNVF